MHCPLLATSGLSLLFLLTQACAHGQHIDERTSPSPAAADVEQRSELTDGLTEHPGPDDPIAPFEGRYELIRADRDLNECPVELSVGVTEIFISRAPPLLHTVGEDRDYSIRVDGDAIVGEARFPSEIGSDDACPDSTIFERWRLTLQNDTSLSGIHEAIWLFPPDCSRPCRVSFSVSTGPRGVTGLSDTI